MNDLLKHPLISRKCVPCEGGMNHLRREDFQQYLTAIAKWNVVNDSALERIFKFKNFSTAMSFINDVAEVAEHEGHHPDILLFGWNKVKLTLTTHAIGGLSLNDFIVAAKVDQIGS